MTTRRNAQSAAPPAAPPSVPPVPTQALAARTPAVSPSTAATTPVAQSPVAPTNAPAASPPVAQPATVTSTVPAAPAPSPPVQAPTAAQGPASGPGTASSTAMPSLPPTTQSSAPSSASTGQVATVASSSPTAPTSVASASAAAAAFVNAAMAATPLAPAIPPAPTPVVSLPVQSGVSQAFTVPSTATTSVNATTSVLSTNAPATVPPPASVTPSATPQAVMAAPQAPIVPPPVPAALAGLRSGGTGPPPPPGSSSSSDNASSDEGEDVVRVSLKIDTKNMRTAKYTGVADKGSFDSGALEWWNGLQEDVDAAQLMAGQRWSNRIKKLVLTSFLDGPARRWSTRFRHANPDATFEEYGEALVTAFRPKINYQDLLLRLAAETKRYNETYIEYADRLRVIADNLEGGLAVVANQRQVLITFVNHAVPSLAAEYKRLFDVNECDDPDDMLDEILAKLVKDVGHNGSAADKQSSAPEHGKRRKDNRGARIKTETAKANAVVERKRRPAYKGHQGFRSSGNRNGQFACYVCGSPSHDAAYHRKYIDNSTNGVNNSDRASAKVAAGRED